MERRPQSLQSPQQREPLDSEPRWAVVVVATGFAAAGLAAVGLPGPLAVAVGVAGAVVGVASLVATVIAERADLVGRGVADHREELEAALVDEFVDAPTHGWLADAADALAAARSRHERRPPSAAGDAEAVATAIRVVDAIEDGLRDSKPSRRAWGDRIPRTAAGSYAAAVAGADLTPAAMRLYSDPSNMPDWLGPRTRDVVVRAGAVLDDVRQLHNAEIERAVLLFTLWTRALVVGGAPLLAAVSFGRAPLAGGWRAVDVPWVLASVASAVTALFAPWIAAIVMRRDGRGATARRWLLVAEIPIAAAAIVATPCWAVAAFAAGWTNWWQRPEFTLRRLVLWIVLVGGLLAGGLAIAGAGAGSTLAEIAIAILGVALIADSYGAMLPVSASMMGRALASGVLTSHRARARADARIGDSIGYLLAAARAIERTAVDNPFAAADVRRLRDCARALGVRADLADRWARRAPLDLQLLIATALRDAGTMSGEPRAVVVLEEAERSGEPEAVTVEEPVFHQRRLAGARLRERRAAGALRLLIIEVVREARRHGTGPLVTVCRLDHDRLTLQFANAVPPGPPRTGRGNGADNLSRLVGALPDGRIDVREEVPGSFIDLPDQARRFGVQASFSIRALDAIEDDPT